MKRLKNIILSCVALGMSLSLYAEEAAVVAVPSPMTIDADKEDWGVITATHGIRNLQNKPVAAFRLAYDKQNLYVLFEVIDDSPLKNSATVLEELIKGGDAVGIGLRGYKLSPDKAQRIVFAQVDGEAVVMAMRPKWNEKTPHTFASPVGQEKMDYVGPVKGAKLALKEVPGGYVVEASLPWLSLQLPAKSMYFDAQVILSDPSGTTNAESAWWHTSGGDALTVEDLPSEARLYPDQWVRTRMFHQDPGPREASSEEFRPKVPGIPIAFEIPRDANVSLIVCDKDGFVLRELIRAEAMKAGKHSIDWDGRDRYGEVLPAGSYQWKLAHFDPISSKFLGSVGNSARPPYRTKDGAGSMGGQHGGASAVACSAHGIYLMGGTEEGHPSMRAIDPEGRTLWKRSMGGWGSGNICATSGDNL